MTVTTISEGQHPIVSPVKQVPFTDKSFLLTDAGFQVLNQLYTWVVSTNRIIPCNSEGANFITLTMPSPPPLITQYNDFETFAFIANLTSTSAVTACVVTDRGTLSTLKVFKTDGTQADSGDLVIARQYFLTYNNQLDSSNGGFTLR